MSALKIFNEVYNECSMKFNFKNKTLREVEITKIIDATQNRIMLKFKYKILSRDKKQFKSDTISLTLFRKINFQKKYPENL